MNHADLLKLLLPPVSYDPSGPLLGAELAAEGRALDAAQSGASSLLAEMDPRSAYTLFSDWERAFGLPDSCAGADQSMSQRRAALVARVTGMGGQSAEYFMALAGAAGYAITVSEFTPHSVDDDVDAGLMDEPWRFAWQVHAAAVTVREITVDEDVDQTLASWGNELLECLIRRYQPAHKVALISYGGAA